MLDEATENEIYEQTQVSWDMLKQSAINFCRSYINLEILEKNQNQKQINALLSFNGFSKDKIDVSSFLTKKNNIQFLKMKYLLAFNFDAKLTAFRGQLPKEAIYVFWDSYRQQTRSYKMSMNRLVELADENGRLFLKKRDLKAEEKLAIEQNQAMGFNQKHIIEAQAAYRGVASRLTQFYKKTGVNGLQRKNGLLMWKLNKQWTIARVTNYGDVKEAYIAALMTKHKQNIDKLYGLGPGQPKYYDDLLIESFFNNYIHEVTNLAAVVEEDINFEDGVSQYAVKSKGASLPSLNQYFTVAEFISKKKTPFDNGAQLQEYIKQELFPADAKRNFILGTFNTLGKAVTDEIISETQKKALLSIKKMNKS